MRLASKWLAALCCHALVSPALADIDRPEDLNDTLALLQGAYQASPDIEQATIDRRNQSILLYFAGADQEEPQRAFPDNVHRMLQSAETSEERQAILDRFVEAALATFDASAQDVQGDASQIVPVIRHRDFANATGPSDLVSRPFLADMQVFYAFDQPQSISYLTEDGLIALGLEHDTLAALAWKNFQALDFEIRVEGDWIYLVTFDGNYESTLILSDALWTDIARQIGDIVAIVPARDLVVFTNPGWEGALDSIRGISASYETEFSYPISGALLRWTKDGWIEFE